MATLTELARFHTALDGRGVNHLQRLVAGWGLLADFCFADLLLFAPTVDAPDGERFLVLVAGAPVHLADRLPGRLDRHHASTRRSGRWSPRAFRLGEIIEGEATVAALKERVRVLCIPVRCRGEVIGVLTRESAPSFGRQPGELERTYVDIFNRFARMIAAGDFPFDAEDAETEEAPRVGDGVILLDAAQRVEYTSPNGVSALHRVGVHANSEGLRFGELGLDDTLVRTAFSISAPVTEELEGQADVSVLIRCIPLIDHGAVSGAVVLTRDVSELRRRDRLLLSKDATIREIHHRVKNNLQTISSLLRLQGRRFSSPEAKVAIEESVRRIRAIALVHETLSREAGDDVAFVEIVRPLARMVEEGMSSEDRPVELHGRGRRRLPAGHRGHAAVGGAQRAAAERHRPRLPRRASTSRPRRAGWSCELANDGERLAGHASSTTAWGCRRGSTLDAVDGPRPVDRAHARHLRADGHDHARARRRRRRSPGHGRAPRRARRRARSDALGATTRTDLLRGQEVGDGQRSKRWEFRRCGAGERRTACAAGGAPPRRCRPTRRSPGWWRGRTRGTGPGRRTDGRRPWRSRSARWPGRWCRRGRTGRDRCRGTSATSRQSSRSMVSCRGRLWARATRFLRGGARSRRVRDEFHMPPRYGEQTEERVRLRWTR